MFDYGFAAYDSKEEFYARTKAAWNPGKTQSWLDDGIDMVIGRREGYFIWDIGGRRLIDMHLNGGTYNLGHRNVELVQALEDGAREFDMGNHHFPSVARTALAEALLKTCAPNMGKVIYAAGGGEAIDIALKTARHATKRRRIVSIEKAYHGHTGLAMNAGDARFVDIFLSGEPAEFPHVPFNDLDAMEAALRNRDVAAVIMESIPATYGFPMPNPGYLAGVKRLCEKYGSLYIADEVQTGLMRTGVMWCISKHGVEPDILVTAKGIGGGIYPIACVVVDDRYAGWLVEDGWAHMSTMGGSELGCIVALKVLEITRRPEVASMVGYVSATLGRGLAEIRQVYGDFFSDVRQDGVVMGLVFDHPTGAKIAMRHLYENGVWCIYSALDPRVLQFKPGLLLSPELCEEILERVEVGIARARREVTGTSRGLA